MAEAEHTGVDNGKKAKIIQLDDQFFANDMGWYVRTASMGEVREWRRVLSID